MMQVMFNDAEKDFQKILDTMVANPNTGQSWKCLHIEARDFVEYKFDFNLMGYAEAVIDFYFMGHEGAALLCGSQDLYIVVRDIDEDQLQEIGDELAASLLLDRSDRAVQKTYNLDSQTLEFVFDLCGRGYFFKEPRYSEVLDLPVLTIRNNRMKQHGMSEY